MKLTVLTWLRDGSIRFVGRVIEVLFRLILLLLPLGVFLWVIQHREKASKVSNISVYTNEESTWQHVFPGFLLVAIDPKAIHRQITNLRAKIEAWGNANKYLLTMLVMLLLVLLMFLKGGY